MFDIISADDFFLEIEIAFGRLTSARAKRVADLLFVILGLNHLREWIAPGFKDERKSRSPINDAERFFEAIYRDRSWKAVNDICNQVKHEGTAPSLGAEYGLKIDSWDSVGDVRSFDNGPPSKFTLDGQDIEPLLESVIDFYRTKWFRKTPSA